MSIEQKPKPMPPMFNWNMARNRQMKLLKWKKAKAQKQGKQVDIKECDYCIAKLQKIMDEA